MKKITRKSKIIKKSNIFPSDINVLCALNDGRLAIGGREHLVIYNMKTYNLDIHIQTFHTVNTIVSLSNNRLFYTTYYTESEGPWVDEIVDDYLIELNGKNYKDITNAIIDYSQSYNILYEYSDTFLIAGRSYKHQNNNFNDRIVILQKIDGRYKKIARLEITKLMHFILLNKNLIATLTKYKYTGEKDTSTCNLTFYHTKLLKFIKRDTIERTVKISALDEKFMLIGTKNAVIIYDYIHYKKVKKISCMYPIYKIILYQNIIYIGESEEYDAKKEIYKNRIVEYEFDNQGNFKQIYSYYKPQNLLIDFVKVKDGRIITCSEKNVKIWD